MYQLSKKWVEIIFDGASSFLYTAGQSFVLSYWTYVHMIYEPPVKTFGNQNNMLLNKEFQSIVKWIESVTQQILKIEPVDWKQGWVL